MKILAIDYGRRWIGLALGTSETQFAVPLATLNRDGDTPGQIAKICRDEGVARVVIGLPRIWQGDTALQDEIQAFGASLAPLVRLPVTFVEELFTSRIARSLSPAYARHSIHAQSATLILENYFLSKPKAQRLESDNNKRFDY